MDQIELAVAEFDVRADEVGSNVGQHRFGGEAPEIG
jgi:hypothetical protein